MAAKFANDPVGGRTDPLEASTSGSRGPGAKGLPRSVVLIVDDEPDILESLASLFRESLPHVEVLTAEGADEAETIAQNRHIDLMLVDYKLPERTGAELLKRVRAKKPDMQAVMMTAYPESGVASEATEWAHVHKIFWKPIQDDSMVHEIATLLRRKETRAAEAPTKKRRRFSLRG